MKLFYITILLLASIIPLSAEDQEFWRDGKITPEQPFPAKVIGSLSSWMGPVVVLREVGERGRYCVANLVFGSFSYSIINVNDFDKADWMKKGVTFIDPPAEVESFSWSMGLHRIGRIFGKDDFVTRWYSQSNPRANEQDLVKPGKPSE